MWVLTGTRYSQPSFQQAEIDGPAREVGPRPDQCQSLHRSCGTRPHMTKSPRDSRQAHPSSLAAMWATVAERLTETVFPVLNTNKSHVQFSMFF